MSGRYRNLLSKGTSGGAITRDRIPHQAVEAHCEHDRHHEALYDGMDQDTWTLHGCVGHGPLVFSKVSRVGIDRASSYC